MDLSDEHYKILMKKRSAAMRQLRKSHVGFRKTMK